MSQKISDYKLHDIVRVLKSPGWSTKDRKGWLAIATGNHFDEYLIIQDKLGVSWWVKEKEIEPVGRLDLEPLNPRIVLASENTQQ